MDMVPRVVDISHYESVVEDGFKKAAAAGIWGVICKATQGNDRTDPKYVGFMKLARLAGLRVGAYHFGTNSDVKHQVTNFLNFSKPEKDMLMALDYEDYDAQMSVHQAVDFLREFEKRFGRKAVLYSGKTLKENIGHLSKVDRDYVCSHKMWLSHYNAKYKLPPGFKSFFLHQYTGDAVGPLPHSVPGIKAQKGLDLNVFNGTKEEFNAQWAT